MSELIETVKDNVVLNETGLDGRGNIRARVESQLADQFQMAFLLGM